MIGRDFDPGSSASRNYKVQTDLRTDGGTT